MNDGEIQQRLRGAVRGLPVPLDLESKIRQRIRRPPTQWAQAIAAAVVIAMAAGVAYQEGHLRFTESSQASYIASLATGVSPCMGDALGDHLHCAVFRRYPKDPPSAAQLAHGLGAYRGLLKALEGRVPEGYRMAMAHHCAFHGHQFVHIVFKSGSRLLSLAVTAESAAGEGIEEASAQRFHVAKDATSRYRIFVVSDLSESANRAALISLAPSIKNVLGKIQG